MRKINVTIYNEFYHEQHVPEIAEIYPAGIHGAIRDGLTGGDLGEITAATFDDHVETLTQKRLDDTDVLIWWGHVKHGDVDDAVVEMVCRRVNEGMGLIVLHSGHASKVFRRILGTNTQDLRWRESDDRCRVWTVAQGHPIAEGLGDSFVVPREETYGEQFGIPEPDELVFISWFEGGEVFRSGCTFKRGAGKIFYFQNGHETYPVYHQAEIRRVINNAVRWACAGQRAYPYECKNVKACEGPRAGK
jgi:trehalose utilization protein